MATVDWGVEDAYKGAVDSGASEASGLPKGVDSGVGADAEGVDFRAHKRLPVVGVK